MPRLTDATYPIHNDSVWELDTVVTNNGNIAAYGIVRQLPT